MTAFVRLFARMLLLLLAGTFLATALVLYAPGYEFDEETTDTRLHTASQQGRLAERQRERQLLPAYFRTLNAWAHLDFGTSRQFNRPVSSLLAERAPATCATITIGLALAWILGLGLSLAVSLTESALADRLALTLSTLLLCLPAAGVGLVFLLATGGRGSWTAIAMAIVLFPKVHRFARELLHAQSDAPYVLLARAKGLSFSRILARHLMPVVLPPLAAVGGITVTLAFSASIPLEVVFDTPGIGQLAWQAALARDLPLLTAVTILLSLITVVATSLEVPE